MASNIAKKAVERTSNAFLAEIPHLGKDTPHRVRRGLVNLTQRPQRAQRAYLGESKAAPALQQGRGRHCHISIVEPCRPIHNRFPEHTNTQKLKHPNTQTLFSVSLC